VTPPRVAPVAPIDAGPVLRRIVDAVGRVIVGKQDTVELAVVTLAAGGHLLLEDMPGVGKSTLARALAGAAGGTLARIQFTADLLPADIVGVNVWRQSQDTFEFRQGPVFANFVLADELNRAPPRTQSALLEAMGERQVSVDGHSHPLPRPFMVLATQNPLEHHGTYPLPESQRDRFAMRLSLGYADGDVETALLQHPPTTEAPEPVADLDVIEAAQRQAAAVFVHADLARYAQTVAQATRGHARLRLGVSTRGALAWMAVARAHALLEGRHEVSIDDLQRVAEPALSHRVVTSDPDEAGATATQIIRALIADTPVPR
jgi:MoxR-like ATPase